MVAVIIDAAEILAALRILSVLGLDAGEIPGQEFTSVVLAEIKKGRPGFIARINNGLTASGL